MTDTDEEIDVEMCKVALSDDVNTIPQDDFGFFLTSLPVVAAESNSTAGGELIVADDVIPLDDEYGCLRQQEGQLEQRPSLISVCFFKETGETPLGITLSSVNGVLRICKISSKHPLADTPLRPGDHLIALDNHRSCSQWTSAQAVRYMRECIGHFTMLFSNPLGDPNVREAVVYKANIADRLGVVFHNDEQNRLRIKRLNNFSLVGTLCALQEGDFVESINGSSACNYMDTDVATAMIRSTQSMVSIVAKSINATQVSVRHIDDFSEPGIDTFHTMATVDATANEFSTIINSSSHNTIGNGILEPSQTEFDSFMEKQAIQPRYIYVNCEKPTVDTKLGFVLQPTNGKLQIKSMNRSGLLWASPLREGFEISSIDGKDSNNWTNLDAVVEYLSNRQNNISIVAQNPAGTCSYVVAHVTKTTPRSKVGMSFKRLATGYFLLDP
jgi:hypothetical protein